MTFLRWLVFILLGKIIIHIWQQFHLPKAMKKSEWWTKLHDCDLCSGVWIYTILSFFMDVGLLELSGFGNIPVVDSIVTGIAVSWLVHIFTLGWKAKYEVVVI